MKKQIYFSNISKIGRFITLVLCLTLLVFNVARPVAVSANTAVATYVVTYLGEAATVSAPALTVLLPIIGLGICTVSLYAAVEMAYDMLSSEEIVANWANTMTSGISEGMVVTIPPQVQEYFKNKAVENGKNPPDYIPYMFIPGTFTNLDTISLDKIFDTGTDAAVQESITLLDTIKASIAQMAQKVTDIVTGQGKISTALTNIRTTIVETKNSLKTTLLNINESVGELKNSLKTTLLNINESIGEMKNSLKTTLLNVVESLGDMRNSLKTTLLRIQEAGVAITTSIENISATVVAKLDTIIAKFGSTTADPGQIPPVGQGSDGQQKIPIMIGKGKDLLSKYSTAFLAVGAMLTKFIDLPVIGDLVQFGLALGIFALVVNLANQIISSEYKNGAKSHKVRSAKGG